MVQPYDYSLGTPSTTESFLAGVQAIQNQQKTNAARAAAEASARADQAKIDEANNFRTRAQEVAKDPSPEKLSALYADFPTYGVDIDRFSKSLGDADKRTYGTILQRAIIAKDNGQNDQQVSTIYTQGAEAARASNRPDIAEKFDAAAKMALSPNMDDNFAARSLLNQFDPDAYKIAYERKDPWVVAGNNIYNRKELERAAAASAASGSDVVNVTPVIPLEAADELRSGKVSPAVFDSIFGQGAANKTLQAGGQTGSSPSGNFQGQ
jgi:hypothetical protein